MPQIIKYSFIYLSSEKHSVFPQSTHPIVEFFILTSHGTLVCPLRMIRDSQGPSGGPSVPENGIKMPQIKYSFVHLSSIPIVKSVHSRIFYLDFSWHTSLSMGNSWGPLGALGGAFQCLKWQKMPQIIKYSFVYLSSE